MTLIPTSSPQTSQDYRRRMALKLMMEGSDASPVQHWAQGLARLGQGAIGGYEMYQADQKDKEDEKEAAQAYISVLRGGAPAATGASAPAAPPVSAPVAASSPASGLDRTYKNDEPSPLDPPQGADRTRMMATILGESANQPAQGQTAVASVIRNRAVDGGYGGDTPSGVVMAKNQFEPWNTEAGRARMARALLDPKLAQSADQAIAMAYGEGGKAPEDPTNGAKNFIQPTLQASLGRDMPAWAQKPGVMIGDHKFIGGAPQDPSQRPYQVAGPPTAAPQAAAPQQAAPEDPRKAQIIQLLQGTPAQQKMGRALADQYITQQNRPQDYEYKVRDDGAVVATNKQNPNDIRVVKPPGASDDLARHQANVEATKQAASIAAKSQAEAKTEIPTAALKRDTALETIEKVRKHPGRESFGGAGMTAGLAGFRPGSQAYDFKVMVDQLKGGSFLQAYETLKGGGPIANAEGAKAEAAIARLDRAQTPEAFDEALNDYEGAIKRGFAALETKAGVDKPNQSQGGPVVWERGPDGKPRRKQ